jgi:TetR/AcrR family transcriptional repressor of nem operon
LTNSTTAERIKYLAEGYIRNRGYNSFSFREIADEIGIKSASVHYHFPTKGDLAAAVARRYSERFFEQLGDPQDSTVVPKILIQRYIGAFRHALVKERKVCLCGMLGAEAESLPEPVLEETQRFFQTNLHWLTTVWSRYLNKTRTEPAVQNRAAHMLAALQGALIVARTLDDVSVFERAIESLV